MDEKDRKQIISRFKKVDKNLWLSLSPEEKEKVIFNYYKLTDPANLHITDLISTVWTKSESVSLVVLGLGLGLVGNLTGSALDRYFTGKSAWYDPLIGLLFLVVLFGFSKLEDMIVTYGYRHGNLLKRLTEGHNQ